LPFNTKVVAQHKDEVQTSMADIDSFSITIDKDASKEDLKFVKKTFKKYGYKITFNKVKRNSKNEIINIKINAVGKNTSSQYATKGTTPILPIEFKSDFKKNTFQIGAVQTHNKYKNKNSRFSYTLKFDSIDKKSLLKISNKLSKGLSKKSLSKEIVFKP